MRIPDEHRQQAGDCGTVARSIALYCRRGRAVLDIRGACARLVRVVCVGGNTWAHAAPCMKGGVLAWQQGWKQNLVTMETSMASGIAATYANKAAHRLSCPSD